MNDNLLGIIERYKKDRESVYNTWFIDNEERLKAFRTIRRGIFMVVESIKMNNFGNNFKGSSLETVLNCISEQKQVFRGAYHPFCWKPKLRIPDIYENEKNKKMFGQFLERCLTVSDEARLVSEIIKLDQEKIKGLGPAVANILYFLHPAIFPPFNTAIVKGYNALVGERIKLGSWTEYLKMREGLARLNKEYRNELSSDYGAIAGLLFEIGSGKLLIEDETFLTEKEKDEFTKKVDQRHLEVALEKEEEDLHSEMQYHLLKIGKALGYNVAVASNDKSKSYRNSPFSSFELSKISGDKSKELTTIGLIDVLWLNKDTNKVIAGFEVEKSTSIYSGILRLSDLFLSAFQNEVDLYIVAPDSREKEVTFQLKRPSIKSNGIYLRYILFSDLRQHCESICAFGEDKSTIGKIAKIAS
ncbi:MAG: hypothetical protein HY050_08285 [Actinobacteria bacterium]|nr:hypothetical protein [Actinomycetota bacterium]